MRKINPSAFLWHLCPQIEVRSSNVAYHHKRSSKKFVKWGFSLLCDYLWPRWLVKNATIYLLSSFWTFGRFEVLAAEKPSRPFHSSAASFKSVTENDSLFACAVDALNECDYPSFCRFGALLCGLKGKGLFSWRQPFLHKDHSPKRLTKVIDEFLSKWDILCKMLPNTYFLKISTTCACSYRAFWVGSPLTDGLFCQRIWQPLKTFPLQRPMEYLFSMPAVTGPLLCQFFQSQK